MSKIKTYIQKNNKIKYSDHYSTPEEIYNYYMNKNFYDPCPLYASDFDFRIVNQEMFINPPYNDITKWVDYAIENHKQTNKQITLLVPSRTDTKWFHKLLEYGVTLEFIKGRLKFGGLKNSAPFPSVLIHL